MSEAALALCAIPGFLAAAILAPTLARISLRRWPVKGDDARVDTL